MTDYPKITFTITTSRRLDLFKCTTDSFFYTCMDKDLITDWIISDDGSSTEDIAEMQRMCPEFTILRSPGKGQAENLNNLFAAVKTPIFFHCEDDWLFIKKDNYIRKMLDVMADDETIKNVTLRYWQGGEVESQKTLGLRYNVHKFGQFYHGDLSPEAIQEKTDKTDCNWYGYTLNPGLQHLPTIKRLGPYVPWSKPVGYYHDPGLGEEDYSRFFDRAQAIKYLTMGFKRANLLNQYIQHIGADNSAYTISR
jgi:hypothetical protein